MNYWLVGLFILSTPGQKQSKMCFQIMPAVYFTTHQTPPPQLQSKFCPGSQESDCLHPEVLQPMMAPGQPYCYFPPVSASWLDLEATFQESQSRKMSCRRSNCFISFFLASIQAIYWTLSSISSKVIRLYLQKCIFNNNGVSSMMPDRGLKNYLKVQK